LSDNHKIGELALRDLCTKPNRVNSYNTHMYEILYGRTSSEPPEQVAIRDRGKRKTQAQASNDIQDTVPDKRDGKTENGR